MISSDGFGANRAPWVGVDLKGFPCQGEPENYGPFDYANPIHRRTKLGIVERYHFTPEVQTLRKGKSGSIVGDLAYTLRAFPNHYKALTALSYYQVLYQNEIRKGKKKPVTPAVECYFQRAIHFVPNDPVVHILYASYLKKIKHYHQAEEEYKKAIKLDPDNSKFHYIYGMFLMRQKQYTKALEQAKIVYARKYKNLKLKKKLKAVGVWKE